MRGPRLALIFFATTALGAALAACSGVNAPAMPPATAPQSVSTTVPVPAATSTSVVLPSLGGTQATVTLPKITGAPAGSTVGITVTNARPSAVPSAAPSASLYVALSLPSGAVAQGVPTLATTGTQSQWAYGTITLGNTTTAPAARARRPAAITDQTYSVLFDPSNVGATGQTVTFSLQMYLGLVLNHWYSVSNNDPLVDGAQLSQQVTITSPSTVPDPTKWVVLTDNDISSLVHASTGPCTPTADGCFASTITANNPGPHASGIGRIGFYYYQNPYLISVYDFTAPVPTPTPTPTPMPTPLVASAPNFTFFPDMTELVSPVIPIASYGYTYANVSLPGIASPPPPGTLLIGTSIAPVNAAIAADFATGPHTPIATLTLQFPSTLTFLAPGNLSSDFCFPLGSVSQATIFSYNAPAYKQLATTVATNDATCPNGVHVSAPSDFGSTPIAAGAAWGFVITTP